jgi:hypothetical protein
VIVKRHVHSARSTRHRRGLSQTRRHGPVPALWPTPARPRARHQVVRRAHGSRRALPTSGTAPTLNRASGLIGNPIAPSVAPAI